MQVKLLRAITRLLKSIGYFFYVLWRAIESILIIHPVEIAMRAWYALDPRVYFGGLRIKEIADGYLAKKSNSFVVFVLYAKGPLPLFTSNAIDALAGGAHNLIIVANSALTPLVKAELTEKCHKLIERKNLGRDFGGYKDGVDYVLEHYPDASRLILMNDSVFFFRKALDKLMADLGGPHDFIGVTEVHQFHYHVQSFMLSFGAAALRSKAFVRFWKKYRPISTRRWAIHRGEIRLTRRLTKAGFRPHILYQAAHLLPHLQRRPARDSVESVRLLPVDVRSGLYEEFLDVLSETADLDSLAALEAVAYGIRRLQPGAVRSNAGLAALNNQAVSMEQWSLGIFSQQIIGSISRNNQMHHGGFLFIKYLGLPILKRDIFYRELYTLEDVYQFLTDIGEPLRDEVMADLRRTGSGAHLKGLFRIMFRHGSL